MHPRLATALALTSDGASTATSTPGSDPDDPVATGDSSPAMACTTTEHFTPREVTLLALLPTHLSYAQIGERLYLSVNSVKTNLKSVYRKLGAGSRNDAVDRARAAGLL